MNSCKQNWIKSGALIFALIAQTLTPCLAGPDKSTSAPAQTSALEQPIDLADNPAKFIAAFPDNQGIADSDPRIAKARSQLQKVANATGEAQDIIAARCVKLARYLFDSVHVQATPVEVLEALALHARTGTSLSDTSSRYFQARRLAPNKTHAEAMAALSTEK